MQYGSARSTKKSQTHKLESKLIIKIIKTVSWSLEIILDKWNLELVNESLRKGSLCHNNCFLPFVSIRRGFQVQKRIPSYRYTY